MNLDDYGCKAKMLMCQHQDPLSKPAEDVANFLQLMD